ncbi:nuclease-related domain-containing protein [Bacillus sp. Marseille-Q3570]|uniref:nuclease-related domain-containing protein n=1 Tax=Bacillus sp. Marseille-Q3570 TaxID=2963522 RepID=UPI0021B848F5|nr:nuclease-related domain-containing protein [Bacillus sp. Marseille-Q3570]
MTQKITFHSPKIEKLEAILRRCPPYHPKRAKAEILLSKSKAGEKGERSLDYPLSFLDEKGYTIFNGTRLSSGEYYFQLDSLLTHAKFTIILEVKNLAGKLIFDTAHSQLIQQLDDGREVIYKDPIQQVEHQHFQLRRWLEQHKFPNDIPIYSFVVVTNDSAQIVPRDNEKLLTEKVLRNSLLRITIENLHHNHTKEYLSTKDLRKLKKLIIKHHTPHDPDLLSQLEISKDELITGVRCPHCFTIPMKRIHGKWICHTCQTVSKDAHLNALRDYYLLIQPAITNQQLRNYLQIDSRNSARYLLQSLKLQHKGNTSRLSYDLSALWSAKKFY